jgi:hypothetical protein
MSGPPVQQYVPPSSYAQPQPPEGKKGMSPMVIAVIIIVVIVVMGIIAMLAFVSMIASIDGEPWEETDTFESDVYIDEGGHFRYELTDGWSDEFQANITIGSMEGGPFDVYIMTTNEYENAYGNASTGAFSATFKWQNMSSVIDMVLFESLGETYYLVVDNVDMPHVPGNAVPEGPIRVSIELEMTSRFASW